jgi:hypothetical protein
MDIALWFVRVLALLLVIVAGAWVLLASAEIAAEQRRDKRPPASPKLARRWSTQVTPQP